MRYEVSTASIRCSCFYFILIDPICSTHSALAPLSDAEVLRRFSRLQLGDTIPPSPLILVCFIISERSKLHAASPRTQINISVSSPKYIFKVVHGSFAFARIHLYTNKIDCWPVATEKQLAAPFADCMIMRLRSARRSFVT